MGAWHSPIVIGRQRRSVLKQFHCRWPGRESCCRRLKHARAHSRGWKLWPLCRGTVGVGSCGLCAGACHCSGGLSGGDAVGLLGCWRGVRLRCRCLRLWPDADRLWREADLARRWWWRWCRLSRSRARLGCSCSALADADLSRAAGCRAGSSKINSAAARGGGPARAGRVLALPGLVRAMPSGPQKN